MKADSRAWRAGAVRRARGCRQAGRGPLVVARISGQFAGRVESSRRAPESPSQRGEGDTHRTTVQEHRPRHRRRAESPDRLVRPAARVSVASERADCHVAGCALCCAMVWITVAPVGIGLLPRAFLRDRWTVRRRRLRGQCNLGAAEVVAGSKAELIRRDPAGASHADEWCGQRRGVPARTRAGFGRSLGKPRGARTPESLPPPAAAFFPLHGLRICSARMAGPFGHHLSRRLSRRRSRLCGACAGVRLEPGRARALYDCASQAPSSLRAVPNPIDLRPGSGRARVVGTGDRGQLASGTRNLPQHLAADWTTFSLFDLNAI